MVGNFTCQHRNCSKDAVAILELTLIGDSSTFVFCKEHLIEAITAYTTVESNFSVEFKEDEN